MFCTFTTKDGVLILRTQDVRRLEDRPHNDGESSMCVVVWVENEHSLEPLYRDVLGTARENLDRPRAEEHAAVKAAHEFERQLQQPATRAPAPVPIVPIGRGRIR